MEECEREGRKRGEKERDELQKEEMNGRAERGGSVRAERRKRREKSNQT